MVASKTLRDELLERYLIHAQSVTGSVYHDVSLAWPYYEANYRSILDSLPHSSRICEVGPGHGSLLAWLKTIGFERLTGIEASPGDVAFANEHLGSDVVALGDAQAFLSERLGEFDLVIMKAVLEHVRKPELATFLRAASASLSTGGTILIDVPNMDWLMASHERYMDLTHEVGFTRESLTTLLSLIFADVTVVGSQIAGPTRSQRWFRRSLIMFLRRVLYILGEGASDLLFESRSLVATAHVNR
jgi:2-polyprenyl-3-methyl-5-hydroxy-6-metoxy-1,4-benzoquinol methylase